MKKLITRYTGIIPLIAFCTCAFGQNSKLSYDFKMPASKEVAYAEEKKSGNMEIAPENLSANISAKALKDFTKTHAKNFSAKWYVIMDGFVAQYKEDGITTKVFYDKKGRWVADLLTYQEDKLPKAIRHLVKSTYYDFNINIVNEVRAGNATAYLVKIEGKTSFKTIHVQDGEMTEKESFEKSK